MTDLKLQVVFEAIVEDFVSGDSLSVENAYYEMHKNWRSFLEAGFDVASVIEMMSPADVWEHYDELLAYGAVIDMSELFRAFGEFFDEDFIKEHWNELVDRGISPDLLVDRYYDSDTGCFDNAKLKEVITKGVSARKALELMESWLEFLEEWPEEQVEILTWLHEHGLSKDHVKEWLEKHASSYMEDYIIDSGSDFYEKFGMDVDAAIEHWLGRYGYQYFGEYRLSDLPDTISVDRVVGFFSMKEIIENCSPYSFDGFIVDYLETGRSIDELARKFVDEIGYSSDSMASNAMLDLVLAGASTAIIDPEKFVHSIDLSQMDEFEAGIWYDCLESIGYDKQIISKLL